MPLTWRNVDAPNFANASEAQRLSQVMLQQGLGALGTALDKYGESQVKNAVGLDAQELAGIKTTAELDAALKSGIVSPEALEDPNFRAQVLARRNDLLVNEQQALQNVNTGLEGQGISARTAGQVIQNKQGTENLNQTTWTNANVRKEYDAMPAATASVNSILAKADGSPEGLRAANAELEKAIPALSASGMNGDDITELRNRIRSSTTENISVKGTLDTEQQRTLGLQQDKDALNAFTQAKAQFGTPQTVKSYLLKTIRDPIVLAKAMELVDKNIAGFQSSDMSTTATEQQIAEQKTGGATGGSIVDMIVGAESSGDPNAQNQASSAGGLGQFIDSTWLNMVKKYRPDVASGKSDAEILNLKGNAALSREMTGAYANENSAYLQGNGIEANPTNVYLAHFLGPNDAVKVLKSNANTPLESLLGADKITANPFLKGMTVADVRNWSTNKMSGKGGKVTGPESAADRSSTAIAKAVAAAPGSGVTRALYDEGTKLSSYAQILNDQASIKSATENTLPMLQEIMSGTPGQESDILKKLHSDMGDEDGLTLGALTSESNALADRLGVAPHVAAALLKNAVEQSAWGTRWLQGDLKIDQNELDTFAKKFIDKDAKDAAGKIRPALELANQIRQRKYDSDKLTQSQEKLTAAETEYASQVMAQQSNPEINTREAAQRLILAQDAFRKEITRVDGSAFSGGAVLGGGGGGGGGGAAAAAPAAATADTATPAPEATDAKTVAADAEAAAKAATGGETPKPKPTAVDAKTGKPTTKPTVPQPDIIKTVADTLGKQPPTKTSRAAQPTTKPAPPKEVPAKKSDAAAELEKTVAQPEPGTPAAKAARQEKIIDQVAEATKTAVSSKRAKQLAKILEDEGIPEDDWPAGLKKLMKRVNTSEDDED